MKKKISLVSAAAFSLLVAVLTFQITYVALKGEAADRKSLGLDDSDSFISEAAQRLAELDSTYRELYIGELDDETLINSVLKGYVAGTGDKYGVYYSSDELADFMSDLTGESEGIGINVIYDTDNEAIEVLTVQPDSPALAAGLREGDLIVYVGENREAVSELGYNGAVAALRGSEGTEAQLTVMRDGELLDFSITRAKVTATTVYYHACELDDSVGIIRITGFDRDATVKQFKEAYSSLEEAGCTSFIFDLRNNPGGELTAVVETLDYLLPEGPIIRIFDKDDNMVDEYTSDAECKDQPMAVLINSNTASAAELFTSALRDYDKAVIVGETSYGKGCMQSSVTLPDGGALSVTYRMYKPPFSESYHGKGISPDVEIAPEGALLEKHFLKVTDSEDNQLKAALAELTK